MVVFLSQSSLPLEILALAGPWCVTLTYLVWCIWCDLPEK